MRAHPSRKLYVHNQKKLTPASGLSLGTSSRHWPLPKNNVRQAAKITEAWDLLAALGPSGRLVTLVIPSQRLLTDHAAESLMASEGPLVVMANLEDQAVQAHKAEPEATAERLTSSSKIMTPTNTLFLPEAGGVDKAGLEATPV
jgi:hypothetical protein